MTSQLGDTVFDLAVGRHTDGGLVILAACQNGVFISIDMAETWSGLWLEGMATAIAASPNFASDGVIIAGVHGGIIQSDDAGASWAFRSLDDPRSLIASVSIRTSNGSSHLMLAGSVDDGLYRSVDWGVTWRPSNCGAYIPRITSVLAGNGQLSLAGTDVGLFVSTNDGLTWDDELAGEIDAEVTVVAMKDNLILIGTAHDGVYAKCMNPNQTWFQLADSALVGAISAIATVPDSDGSIRVVTVGNTHAQQYRLNVERNSPPVYLLRTDVLPTPALTSTVLPSGATVLAVVADTQGSILPFSIGLEGLSSAHLD
jgi:hypothetical protein